MLRFQALNGLMEQGNINFTSHQIQICSYSQQLYYSYLP